MHFALALLIAVSAGEVPRQAPRYGTRDPARMYTKYLGDRSGDAPNCLADSSCVGFCGTGVYDGGTEWQCVAGPASGQTVGAAIAVTQGAGATYENAPFELPDAGPYLASRNSNGHKSVGFSDMLSAAYAGNHTVVIVASAATAGEIPLFHGGGFGSSGLYVQMESNGITCVWNNSGATPTAATPNPTSLSASSHASWRVYSCRRSGTSYTARANGAQASVTWAFSALAPPGGSFVSMNGSPIWRVYLYNSAKTDTEMSAIEAGIWGAQTNRGPVTTVRSGTATATLADSVTYTWGDNAPRVDPRYGLLCSGTEAHTISTAGWPSASGEVALSYTPISAAAPPGNNVLLDSRTTATTQGVLLYRDNANRITLRVYASVEVCTVVTAAQTWTALTAKRIKARWTPTSCEVLADGVSVGTGVATGSPASHDSAANIGSDLNGGGGDNANGYEKNLCVGAPGRCP